MTGTDSRVTARPPRDAGPRGLRRVLGFWGTAALSVGVMAPTLAMSIVGPEPARIVGHGAPLAFALAALLVFAVSAGFVRLSAEFADAGSVYAFVGRAVSPRAGIFTGWTLLGTYLVFPWVSVAGITVFAQAFLATVGLPAPDWYVLALLGWLAVGVLAAGGVRLAARSMIAVEIVAILLILALMAIVVAALADGSAPRGLGFDAAVLTLPDGVPPGALVVAATAAFLAFCGFEAAGSLGDEAHRPRRDVPRAMLATVGLGAVFYVGCVTVQTWGFGTDAAGVAAFGASPAPLGELALAYSGPVLAAALHAVALVSAVGAGLGCAMVAVRMLYALGRDGVLPAALGRVSRRTGTPSVALGVELAVGLVLVTAFRLAGATPVQLFFTLAVIGVLHLLVMYSLTNLAAARLLRRRGDRPVAPLVGAVVAVAVLGHTLSGPAAGPALVVAGWLLLGVLFVAVRRVPGGAR